MPLGIAPLSSRLFRIVVITVVATAVLIVVGLQVSARALQGQVTAALGARTEVASTSVGWSGVVLTGVRVRSERSKWPAEDELRAARIVVTPDLRSLFGGEIRVSTVRVEAGYLSVFRTRAGKVLLLPALLEREGANGKPGTLPAVTIRRIELHDAAIDFYDASVRQPAVLERLEQIDASLTDLRLPSLTGRSALQIDGVHKGVAHNGTMSLNGNIELARLDSTLALRLRGIDLLAFQPYLVKAMETGVRKGSVDLDLDATVRKRHLHAPGSLVIAGLELAPSDGHSLFAGMSRKAVIAFMKDRKERIAVHFTLDGNLDDPAFSINENFATRVAAALGETVGMSVEGTVRGVGEVAGDAVKGVGTVVKKLFGGR